VDDTQEYTFPFLTRSERRGSGGYFEKKIDGTDRQYERPSTRVGNSDEEEHRYITIPTLYR